MRTILFRLNPIILAKSCLLLGLSVGTVILAHFDSPSQALPFVGVDGITLESLTKDRLKLRFQSDLPLTYRLTHQTNGAIVVTLKGARLSDMAIARLPQIAGYRCTHQTDLSSGEETLILTPELGQSPMVTVVGAMPESTLSGIIAERFSEPLIPKAETLASELQETATAIASTLETTPISSSPMASSSLTQIASDRMPQDHQGKNPLFDSFSPLAVQALSANKILQPTETTQTDLASGFITETATESLTSKSLTPEPGFSDDSIEPTSQAAYNAQPLRTSATRKPGIQFTLVGSDEVYTAYSPSNAPQNKMLVVDPFSRKSSTNEAVAAVAISEPTLMLNIDRFPEGSETTAPSPQSSLKRWIAQIQADYNEHGAQSAIIQAQKALLEEPNAIPVELLLGELFIETEQFPLAANLYQTLLTQASSAPMDDTNGLVNKAELSRWIRMAASRYATVLLHLGDAKKGILALTPVLKQHQAILATEDWVHFVLGTFYQTLGQTTLALPLLEKSVQLNPQFTDGQYNLALAYEQQGQWKSAHAHYQKALQLSPNDSEISMALQRVRPHLSVTPKATLPTKNRSRG